VHHSKIGGLLTALGQNLRLPHRTIGIRFTPDSGHPPTPWMGRLGCRGPAGENELATLDRDPGIGRLRAPTHFTSFSHTLGNTLDVLRNDLCDLKATLRLRISCKN
jgi:hypothetical protein